MAITVMSSVVAVAPFKVGVAAWHTLLGFNTVFLLYTLNAALLNPLTV